MKLCINKVNSICKRINYWEKVRIPTKTSRSLFLETPCEIANKPLNMFELLRLEFVTNLNNFFDIAHDSAVHLIKKTKGRTLIAALERACLIWLLSWTRSWTTKRIHRETETSGCLLWISNCFVRIVIIHFLILKQQRSLRIQCGR